MPLPIILGIGAAIAGIAGVGSGISGAVKMQEAKETVKKAQDRHEDNMDRFKRSNARTNERMDELGKFELDILKSFEQFSNLFEQIKNKPEFKECIINGVELPKYDEEKLKEVSVGAGVLLGAISGAGVGAAGGFAAAGAATAAVAALGTASTGTAIASLSGAALTNATLAALGGGALAAGGGGMALGTAILGASTLGVGLLVGGIIFNFTGDKLSEQADEAWSQMKSAERKIDKICDYFIELRELAKKYYESLTVVNNCYRRHIEELNQIVTIMHKTNWNTFTQHEKDVVQNTVNLVGLLHKMCKTQLVLKGDGEMNELNKYNVNESIQDAEKVMQQIG